MTPILPDWLALSKVRNFGQIKNFLSSKSETVVEFVAWLNQFQKSHYNNKVVAFKSSVFFQ